MAYNFIQSSFAGGEISPSMYGRTDFAKYAVSLAECRNMIVQPHGGVTRRPGTKLVGEVPNADGTTVRLVPFQFSVTQTYVLVFRDSELSVAYLDPLSINKDRTFVQSGGSDYTVASPYDEADLFDLRFTQNADTLFITHPSYAPRKLTRTAHDSWAFTTLSFSPTLNAPTSLSATGNNFSGGQNLDVDYKVSAVDGEGNESVPSTADTVTIKTPWNDGATVTLSWTAPTPPAGSSIAYYNVYKNESGFYGFVGTADTTAFTDINIAPDASITPKAVRTNSSGGAFFGAADEYPAAVALYESRLIAARTNNQPQTVFGSDVGTFTSFTQSQPLLDADSFVATLNANQVNEIRHLLPMDNLLVFTSGNVWSLRPGSNVDVLSPLSLRATIQNRYGISEVPPLAVGESALFVEVFGREVRDIFYSVDLEGLSSANLILLAEHLFDGVSVVDWTYQKFPNSVIWCVMSDGTALSLTYLRDQDVWAWAKHTTPNGLFKSVAAIEGDTQTDVYFYIERDFTAGTKYVVEWLETEHSETQTIENAHYVDSGVRSFTGSPQTTITGLDHLDGEEIVILADGNVVTGKTPSSGSVTLDEAADNVICGLNYESHIKTLPVELSGGGGSTQGRRRRALSASLRLYETRGISASANDVDFYEFKERSSEDYGDPIQPFTGVRTISLKGKYQKSPQITIKQAHPLPFTLLSLGVDYEFKDNVK